MNCATCLELIYDYLDNELDDHMRYQFENHLADCNDCCLELTKAKAALSLYQEWGNSSEIRSDFTEVVLSKLDESQPAFASAFIKLVGAGMIGILTIVVVILAPILYSWGSIWLDFLLKISQVPGILLTAFPIIQTTSMVILAVMLAGMSLAMRHLIKY